MSAKTQNIASRYVERRILLFSAALLALFFGITTALARSYHSREARLAAEWYQNGNADLAAGKSAQAFEDFRSSLYYGPDSRDVQIHLAEALLAAGRFNETRPYLVNLWERAPGSGQVNLDLAHLSIQTEDVQDAIRYFHGAILGSWESEPMTERRKVRLELCEFLLARGLLSDAGAEIAGLAVDTPPDDAELREQNGRLFLKVGEPAKALVEIEAAIRANPHQSDWLAEAGRLALEDGDYFKAETYFSKSYRESPSDEIRASLALVRDVLGDDPFLDGLSAEEQAHRSWHDFQQGLDRLRKCTEAAESSLSSDAAAPGLQQLGQEARELKRRITLPSLTHNAETRADAMNFVARVEDAPSQNCGPGASEDQALRLIEQRHEVSNQ